MRADLPFRVEDTHGVLVRKVNGKKTSSDEFGWSAMYASSQVEYPFEAYFSSVDDQLIVMHRSGPVDVEILNGTRTRQRTVPNGGLHIVPGGTSFGFRLHEQLDTLHCYVRRSVIDEVAAELVEGDPSKVIIRPDFVDDDPSMQSLMRAVHYALEEGDYASTLFVDCLSRAVAVKLIRNYSNATLKEASSYGTAGTITPVIRQAITFIQSRLDETLTLDNIAAAVNRSPSHFARQFRASMGVPPYQYVLSLRLSRARELLQNTRLSIAEIAFETGFSHQEHLTRLFRREFGTTPAVYRKSKQN